MRKEDINSFIQTLLTKGHVVLPGIGLFSIHDQHAHIDLESKSVSPPYRDIVYKQTGNWFHSFKSKPNWLQAFSKYCLSQLKNVGACEIPQIGEIKSDARNQYSFEVDRRYWGKEAGFRSPLSLTEETVTAEDDLQPESLTTAIIATSDDIKEPILEPESEAAQELGVIETMAAAAISVIDKVPLTEEPTTTSITYDSQTNVIEKEASVPEYEEQTVIADSNRSRRISVLWWMLPLILLAAFVLLIKMCGVFKPANTATVVPANVIEDRVNKTPGHSESTSTLHVLSDSTSQENIVGSNEDQEGDDTLIPEDIKASDALEDGSKTNELTSDNDYAENLNCAIIVGAFSRMSNANRMVEHIENMGHVAYIKEVDGLNRVGLVSECSGSEYESLLQFARTEINGEAWLSEIK